MSDVSVHYNLSEWTSAFFKAILSAGAGAVVYFMWTSNSTIAVMANNLDRLQDDIQTISTRLDTINENFQKRMDNHGTVIANLTTSDQLQDHKIIEEDRRLLNVEQIIDSLRNPSNFRVVPNGSANQHSR